MELHKADPELTLCCTAGSCLHGKQANIYMYFYSCIYENLL